MCLVNVCTVHREDLPAPGSDRDPADCRRQGRGLSVIFSGDGRREDRGARDRGDRQERDRPGHGWRRHAGPSGCRSRWHVWRGEKAENGLQRFFRDKLHGSQRGTVRAVF